MKRGLPLLLALCLAACGKFQINIQVNPQPTHTLPPQATFTAERVAVAPVTPARSQTPTATLTPEPASNCPPPAGWSPITMQAGDTLDNLAQFYNATVEALIQANCLVNVEVIPGTILYVPGIPPTESSTRCGPPSSWTLYTVPPGENLYRLGLAFGVTVAELQFANCMGNSTSIRAGLRLFVPNEPTRTATATRVRAETASPTPTRTPTYAALPVDINDPAFPAIQPLEAGQPITLTSIQMMDEAMGWGIEIGGHLLRTRDGGLTWKSITPPRGRYQPGGLFALSGEIAWASPYNLDATCTWTPASCPEELPSIRTAFVWRTDDGGNTWRPSHPFSLGDRDGDTRSVLFYNPVALHFLDAQTGWLLVNVNHLMNQDFYRLYQTVDGGDTWNRLADQQFGPPFCAVFGLGFQDALTGWIGGSCVGLGLEDEAHWGVYQTTDGGQNWNWAALPPPANLPDGFSQYAYECAVETIDLIPPASVGLEMACALRDKTSGYSAYRFYYLSPDGGSNWRAWQMTGEVDFLNLDSGWRQTANATGGYDLERSQDGGQTWALVKTMYWQGQLDFVSQNVGWAIARLGEAAALVKTSDGGQTWVVIKPVAGD